MTESVTIHPVDELDAKLVLREWSREGILHSVHELAQTLKHDVLEREREHRFPLAAYDSIRASGLGALLVPTHLGGPGGNLVDVTQVILSLAAADSNVPHALRLHFNLAELWRLLPPDDFLQRQTQRILAGKLFGGASTELGTAKPGMITTRLSRERDHWVLNGRKFYSTGTLFADYASISAVNEADQPVTVVIPVKRDGLTVLDDWDGFGQRQTASGTLLLQQVRVNDDELRHESILQLGVVSQHISAWRQLILVATAGGIVRALLAEIQDYVLTRGRAALHSTADLARDEPFIQQVIGDVAAHSHAIDALVLSAAQQLELGAQAIAEQSKDASSIVLQGGLATAKTQLIVSKLALYASQQLFEAGGASATSRSLLLDRHWRNLRTIFSHNPLSLKARVVGEWHLNGTITEFEAGRVF